MPIFLDAQTWKLQSQEIMYRDPFSDNTHKIRRRSVFFSFLIVLNYFYPVDLVNTHFLGVAFLNHSAPPLAGILGLLCMFFAIEFFIYTSQELVAWHTQARETLLSQFSERIDSLSQRDKDIVSELKNSLEWLKEYHRSVANLNPPKDDQTEESRAPINDRLKKALDDGIRFERWITSIEQTAARYQERVAEAGEYLSEIKLGMKRAVAWQIVRIGLVELLFPTLMILWAARLSLPAIFEMFQALSK